MEVYYFGKKVDVEDKKLFIDRITKELGCIEFPYSWSEERDSEVVFDRILNYDPDVVQKTFRLSNVLASPEFWTLFKVNFQGKSILIKSSKDNFEKYNTLAEKYNEGPRMKSLSHRGDTTPFDDWRNLETRRKIVENAFETGEINISSLRESVFAISKEARSGKITNYISVYDIFQATTVIDMAAAWGERLIAAIASKNVVRYLGTDPNKDLWEGWNEAKKELIPYTFKKESELPPKRFSNFITVNSGIENLKFPRGFIGDFAIFSPPPFIGEQYSSAEGQSIETFDSFETWFTDFMLKSISRTASFLADGSYMIISVLDIPFLSDKQMRREKIEGKDYKIVELLISSIQGYCPNIHYAGVIGWEGDSGKVAPWWVFRKRIGDTARHQTNRARSLLKRYYPKDLVKRIEDTDLRFRENSPFVNPTMTVANTPVNLRKIANLINDRVMSQRSQKYNSDLRNYLLALSRDITQRYDYVSISSNTSNVIFADNIKTAIWDIILSNYREGIL